MALPQPLPVSPGSMRDPKCIQGLQESLYEAMRRRRCFLKRISTVEPDQRRHVLCPSTDPVAHPSQRPYSASSSSSDPGLRPQKTRLQLPAFSLVETMLSEPNRTFPSSVTDTTATELSEPSRPRIAPLPTPPPDTTKTLSLDALLNQGVPQTHMPGALQEGQHGEGERMADGGSSRTTLGFNLSGPQALQDQAALQHLAWVMRTSQLFCKIHICHLIVESLANSLPVATLNVTSSADHLQVISQTLPSQAKDGRLKPTFQDILEQVQLGLTHVPFITITHAVPEARTMDELPKTPPSTPRPTLDSNDYFGNDQNIFTHAAVVPIYHNHGPAAEQNQQLPRNISAPTVQISILERYIPPTMPQEIDEFFSSSSKRSYLIDRLSELSILGGSLLLIYPTKTGGTTFARDYVGPVLDPFLRQFVLLNNLTSGAAAAMGDMSAVESMIEYDTMLARLHTLCRALTEGPAIRGQKSEYTVVHSETLQVVLERSTWVNWFVQQEQSRLRQNLVDYHQAGGRMPASKGNEEVTVGMLARDVIDGIQKSKEASGRTGIEMGVFMITRSGFA